MKEFLNEVNLLLRNKKNIINLLLLGIMVLAIPLTVKLARQQQILFSRAAAAKVEFLTKAEGGTECVINRGGKEVAVCNDIKVRFTAPTGDDIKFSRTSLLPQEGLVKKAYAQGSCSNIGNSGNGYNADYCTNCDYTWCNDNGGYPMFDLSSCSNKCTPTPPAGGTPQHECAEDGAKSGEDGDSSTPNCKGRKVCHYEGNTLKWGNYTCEECTNGATNPPGCDNNQGGPSGGGSCTDPPASKDSKFLKCNGNAIDHFTCTGNTEAGSNGWSFDENGHEDCPQGTQCVKASGTAICDKGSTPDKCKTDSAGDITQTQAECVLGKKPGMLDFYKSNGWCTDKKEQYPGIVNNWRGINGPDEDQIITDCGIKNVKCKTDSAGDITATQASCVVDKKAGLLEFYKNNRWCTDKTDYYPGIVNNWKGIITLQADKDILSSCGIDGGGAQKCFVCVNVAGKGNVWRHPGDSRGQTPNGNAGASCTDPVDSCSGNRNSCKGLANKLDTACRSGGTPAVTKYRYAEERSKLASAQENDFQGEFVDISFKFANEKPEQKFIWVEFGDGAGNWTQAQKDEIFYAGPDPKITRSACDVNQNIKDGSLVFIVKGNHFGAKDLGKSRLSADGTNLDTACQGCNWDNTTVTAIMANPPDTTKGKSYTVILTRADGVTDTASCSVATIQVSVGAKAFCRAPSNFDHPNVNLTVVENALGVGTSASQGSFKRGNTAKEVGTISKEGMLSLKTKLQEGLEYIICLKACPTCLQICTDKFTAIEGTNKIPNFKGIPMCDVNEDGTINAVDTSQCKSQWGLGKNKTCDFNRDDVTNSFEWACCIHPDSFNKSNQQEPQ